MGEMLKNKKFIITGASKGLGEVIAKDFSKYGMKLALLARDINELKKVKGICEENSSCEVFTIDLLDLDSIEGCMKNVVSYLGEVDGIIHVAGGGYGFKDPLLEHDKFTKLLNVNLLSVAEINRCVVPYMEKNGGNLVHVGSITSTDAVGSVGYNTAKAGLAAYVRSLGNELAKYEIIAAGILPGGFHAPNNAMDRLKTNNKEAYDNFVETRLPRNKMGEAEELLPLIKLLSTKDASMMNGSMVAIDGGEGKSYERI
jgi:NAD(P)-dependent dehydrogenase (short-subunit alcohol dehydrogenase family)